MVCFRTPSKTGVTGVTRVTRVRIPLKTLNNSSVTPRANEAHTRCNAARWCNNQTTPPFLLAALSCAPTDHERRGIHALGLGRGGGPFVGVIYLKVASKVRQSCVE